MAVYQRLGPHLSGRISVPMLTAIVGVVLISTVQIGCSWQFRVRYREPKLLWKTELPRPWSGMYYSSPVSDREDRIVVITGMSPWGREKSFFYKDIICCVCDANSGMLITSPIKRFKLCELEKRKGRGGLSVNFCSFMEPAHPMAYPCGPNRLVVVASGAESELDFYVYKLEEKTWAGPFISDPPVGAQSSDMGCAKAEVLWDIGKLYCFQPTATIKIGNDRFTEYDLIEFDLEKPHAKGTKVFTFRTAGNILDVIRPTHPGDPSFKWMYVFDNQNYVMEYNSDTRKVNILAQKAYDINDTRAIYGYPTCVYNPDKKKILHFGRDLALTERWLEEISLGEKKGRVVWRDRAQKRTRPDYLLAPAKLNKLGLFLFAKSKDESLEEYEIVMLRPDTYKEQYRWIETGWTLWGAQFSRDGKRLYLATCEQVEEAANQAKYKDYLKCYLLEE